MIPLLYCFSVLLWEGFQWWFLLLLWSFFFFLFLFSFSFFSWGLLRLLLLFFFLRLILFLLSSFWLLLLFVSFFLLFLSFDLPISLVSISNLIWNGFWLLIFTIGRGNRWIRCLQLEDLGRQSCFLLRFFPRSRRSDLLCPDWPSHSWS